MRVFKRLLVICLVAALLTGILYPAAMYASAAEYILEPSALKGRDYTGSDRLAKKLDEVFSGDIGIYSDSKFKNQVSMPVGISMSNKTQYYVKSGVTGNPVSGWQCYIYANAVYNRLFNEWVGHATGFVHSRVVIPGGGNALSYELMRNSGVLCGAYLRTTGNSDGSYSGSVGHSIIILGYDRDNITYLEGNADGKGLIRVTIRSWANFNQKLLTDKGRYISHIVQPTDAYYKEKFPDCNHSVGYEGLGVCTGCGYIFDWGATFDPWSAGIYRLTADVTPRRDQPYTAGAAADLTLTTGQKIKALGRYVNAFDQVWYSFANASGNIYYINGASLKFVEYLPFEVDCTGVTPENEAVLSPKSYPVTGTITANYPLKTVYAYLDGEEYARWTAPDESTTKLDIRKTDINYDLAFSKLSGGRHTLVLTAESFVHGQAQTIHESVFYMVTNQPCTHSYSSQVTLDATCTQEGLLTYTCSACEDTYTRVIAPYGHNYLDGVCSYCGDRLPLVTLTGAIAAAGSKSDPVTITLTGEDGRTYTAATTDGTYSISGIIAGTYSMAFSKTGCVSGSHTLTLSAGTVTQDIKLCPPGDVTGDGTVNIGDVGKMYAQIRGTGQMTDPYTLLCADLTGDGHINVGDVGRIYARIRGRLK